MIAIAQNIPMAQLPNYFAVIMGYGPLFGIVAVAPLFVALVVAGPIAGYLLGRVSPRTLVGGGIVAVGVGNLAMGLILGRDASYIGFVLPLLVIGGGFVIATTVRTAIIFASVPRGLPATAAALNEASLQVGARAGILVSTAIIGQVGLSTLDATLAQAGVSAETAAAQHDQFAGLLAVFGTPAFASLVGSVHPDDIAGYADAYLAGLRSALMLGGAAAIARRRHRLGGPRPARPADLDLRAPRRAPPRRRRRLTRPSDRRANDGPGRARRLHGPGGTVAP